MKDFPILFSGPMVRAILAGRKTQTRRVMKPVPAFPESYFMKRVEIVGNEAKFYRPGASIPAYIFRCPLGQPGDRLWVRETWKVGAWREDGRIAIDYAASPEITNTPWTHITDDIDGDKFNALTLALADELERKGVKSDDDGYYHWEAGKSPLKWRPSIHMPRWASRITLKVTEVRVQRLQEITDEDAIAEGVEPLDAYVWKDYLSHKEPQFPIFHARDSFTSLWDSLNGEKPSRAWNRNPWVWVVEYDNPQWKGAQA